MARGAESIVTSLRFFGISCVKKNRVEKKYRNPVLDQKLRFERTRQEARLLHKAKQAGVPAPTVLYIENTILVITKISGKRPLLKTSKECNRAGELLATLHGAGIIHGDYTAANLLTSKDGLTVIDFGLGFFSKDLEDQAIDVVTMLDSLTTEDSRRCFCQGYATNNPSYDSVMKRIAVIKKRARYS